MTDRKFKLAALQEAPVYHDLEPTLEKGARMIARAAAEGCAMLVFPEAWFPGYPDFCWALAPENEAAEVERAFDRYRRNAVDLSRDGLAPIRAAARAQGVVVVAGVTERATGAGAGTLYNASVTIDATGEIVNHRRKVMPTGAERTVWGFGDASGLTVAETAVGRVGVLLCWENYMPLARAALWAQNVEILAAPTADGSQRWNATMQHEALEGGVWVLGVDLPLEAADLPEDLPARAAIMARAEDWPRNGNAVICDPEGQIVAGPMRRQKGLLVAEADLGAIAVRRRHFDVCGHYARPDLFQLHVDRRPQSPVVFG